MAAWFDNAIDCRRRDDTVRDAIHTLRKYDFDTIAVCGVSGLLLGPILAYEMGKRLVVVRKKDDSSHSCSMIEGYCGDKYVIVDDLIASGATVNLIRQHLASGLATNGSPPECVGFYGYYDTAYYLERKGKCDLVGINFLNLCPAPSNA